MTLFTPPFHDPDPVASFATSVSSLPPSEALSTLLGSISLTCWIFVLLPQIIENYRNQSASAISLPFILLWSAGDVCNLVGAVWAGVVVETVIAVAVYWCVTDVAIVGQWLFYYFMGKRSEGGQNKEGEAEERREQQRQREADDEEAITEGNEEDPLLARQRGRRRSDHIASTSLAGSESTPKTSGRPRASDSFTSERASTTTPYHSNLDNTNPPRTQPPSQSQKAWLKNTLSVLAVIAIGTAGWAIAGQFGAWDPPPSSSPPPSDPNQGSGEPSSETTTSPLGAQILGYLSAVAYLSARVPQIIKNARSRSCQGLSLLFFLLSLLGNLSYGASILAHSLDRAYLIANTPWLIGSLGTVGQDCVVFAQFWSFGREVASS